MVGSPLVESPRAVVFNRQSESSQFESNRMRRPSPLSNSAGPSSTLLPDRLSLHETLASNSNAEGIDFVDFQFGPLSPCRFHSSPPTSPSIFSAGRRREQVDSIHRPYRRIDPPQREQSFLLC